MSVNGVEGSDSPDSSSQPLNNEFEKTLTGGSNLDSLLAPLAVPSDVRSRSVSANGRVHKQNSINDRFRRLAALVLLTSRDIFQRARLLQSLVFKKYLRHTRMRRIFCSVFSTNTWERKSKLLQRVPGVKRYIRTFDVISELYWVLLRMRQRFENRSFSWKRPNHILKTALFEP